MQANDEKPAADAGPVDLVLGAWQPIATAPRDGRRVLVWIAEKSYTGHAFAKLWFYSTDGRLGGGAEGYNGDWNITHWQPLPPPPAERCKCGYPMPCGLTVPVQFCRA